MQGVSTDGCAPAGRTGPGARACPPWAAASRTPSVAPSPGHSRASYRNACGWCPLGPRLPRSPPTRWLRRNKTHCDPLHQHLPPRPHLQSQQAPWHTLLPRPRCRRCTPRRYCTPNTSRCRSGPRPLGGAPRRETPGCPADCEWTGCPSAGPDACQSYAPPLPTSGIACPS